MQQDLERRPPPSTPLSTWQWLVVALLVGILGTQILILLRLEPAPTVGDFERAKSDQAFQKALSRRVPLVGVIGTVPVNVVNVADQPIRVEIEYQPIEVEIAR